VSAWPFGTLRASGLAEEQPCPGADRIPCAMLAETPLPSCQPAVHGQASQPLERQGAQTLPGWFGKLPGMGDFAHRRLPAPFRENWDSWLQDGLMGLRARHADDWTARYLESPLWCFTLGQDTVDANAWIGVLMPSVDGVGRYFPFVLARPFDVRLDATAWWTCAARAALEALNADFDAECFEAWLAQCFSQTHAPGEDAPPPAGQSLWCAQLQDDSGLQLAFAGLPRGARFDVLFGFAQDAQPRSRELPP